MDTLEKLLSTLIRNDIPEIIKTALKRKIKELLDEVNSLPGEEEFTNVGYALKMKNNKRVYLMPSEDGRHNVIKVEDGFIVYSTEVKFDNSYE